MKVLHQHFYFDPQNTLGQFLIFLAALISMYLLAPISIEAGLIDLSFQTFSIMLVCLFFRAMPVFFMVLIYLVSGIFGLPVFSGYSSGLEHFTSISGIFLFLFPLFALGFSLAVPFYYHSFWKIAIAAILAQIILLLVGFSWIYFTNEIKPGKILSNLYALFPGLLIKGIAIALINHFIILPFFASTKSIN